MLNSYDSGLKQCASPIPVLKPRDSEAIGLGTAYFIDFLGKKKKADKSVFYRTFSQQKENDFILCKKAIAEKTTEMLIDYRTLSFTDHCAVIAEFEV